MTASTELGIKASSDTFLLPCVAPLFLKEREETRLFVEVLSERKISDFKLLLVSSHFGFFLTLDASLSSIFIGKGIKHGITKM